MPPCRSRAPTSRFRRWVAGDGLPAAAASDCGCNPAVPVRWVERRPGAAPIVRARCANCPAGQRRFAGRRGTLAPCYETGPRMVAGRRLLADRTCRARNGQAEIRCLLPHRPQAAPAPNWRRHSGFRGMQLPELPTHVDLRSVRTRLLDCADLRRGLRPLRPGIQECRASGVDVLGLSETLDWLAC